VDTVDWTDAEPAPSAEVDLLDCVESRDEYRMEFQGSAEVDLVEPAECSHQVASLFYRVFGSVIVISFSNALGLTLGEHWNNPVMQHVIVLPRGFWKSFSMPTWGNAFVFFVFLWPSMDVVVVFR